jgi:septal ring factor EnvC (AmiA/AmiB activator)
MRSSLDSRRADIIEVLAALQRAGRRTPPALLVRPEDALQSLRTAMLLGAVVPELRGRAEKLASELGELVALRKNIATERDQLALDRDRIRNDQTRLTALVDERQRQQASREKDLDAENSRAITLSKQVGDLQGLIAKMEQDLQSAAKAAEAARQAEAKAAASAKSGPAAFKDRSRTTPAIAFASAKGLLPLPVNGNKIRDFGGSDGIGGVQKGISLASRPGSQVTTPCDGWVVYAGPFRSYGQLLILNAGGGYHVLIAGMERISVNIGQFVLTGEPVATMGSTSQVASILATNASQPVLYVEFRKDGTPIDPGPWWAANEGEKVRG